MLENSQVYYNCNSPLFDTYHTGQLYSTDLQTECVNYLIGYMMYGNHQKLK